MKHFLLFISLLALTGCDENPLKPDFKEGDCAVLEGAERWESKNIKKILEVGNDKYRILWVKPEHMKGYETERYISSFDRLYRQTECPNEQ